MYEIVIIPAANGAVTVYLKLNGKNDREFCGSLPDAMIWISTVIGIDGFK